MLEDSSDVNYLNTVYDTEDKPSVLPNPKPSFHDGPVSMPLNLDSNNDETVPYEFGDGVYELLRDLPTIDLQTSNSSSIGSPIIPQPLHKPTSILGNPMSQKQFFDYMENFGSSLGTILEKKLASVIGDST